jgi:hypothetical protein
MQKSTNLFLVILLCVLSVNGQDLTKHQWKDRLILIVTEDENNKKYQQQLSELKKHQGGINDRQLIIYRILPGKYNIGFAQKNWNNSALFYKKYNAEENIFLVMLIGLDGNEKLVQTEVISAEKLFNTIDSMPIRKS